MNHTTGREARWHEWTTADGHTSDRTTIDMDRPTPSGRLCVVTIVMTCSAADTETIVAPAIDTDVSVTEERSWVVVVWNGVVLTLLLTS